jgi:hypothetical protein
MMNKDILASSIKQTFPELDNKALNTFCVALWGNVSKWHREEKDKALKKAQAKSSDASTKNAPPDDWEGYTEAERSEKIGKWFDWQVETGEMSASEFREAKDMFNLKAKDQDIHIEQVDFRSIEPELADVVAAVEWQIVEYNKEDS